MWVSNPFIIRITLSLTTVEMFHLNFIIFHVSFRVLLLPISRKLCLKLCFPEFKAGEVLNFGKKFKEWYFLHVSDMKK